LVDNGRAEDFEAVINALKAGEPAQRAAIRRALSVVPRTDLGQRLAALALKAPPNLQADLLEVLGHRRVEPELRLEALLAQHEALAIRLARVFPTRLDPVAVHRGLSSSVGAVRAASLVTMMVLGHRTAPAACTDELRAGGPAFSMAALLLGLSGEER